MLVVQEILIERMKMGFSGGSNGKESASNAGEVGSIPGLGRPLGGGHGNPLQYSCLGIPMDRRGNGVAKNWTQLRD